MTKQSTATPNNKRQNKPSGKGRGGDDPIFVGRNMRRIQRQAGVPRAAKGAGTSMLQYDIMPPIRELVRQCMHRTQMGNRRTVKESTGLDVYVSLFSEKPAPGTTRAGQEQQTLALCGAPSGSNDE